MNDTKSLNGPDLEDAKIEYSLLLGVDTANLFDPWVNTTVELTEIDPAILSLGDNGNSLIEVLDYLEIPSCSVVHIMEREGAGVLECNTSFCRNYLASRYSAGGFSAIYIKDYDGTWLIEVSSCGAISYFKEDPSDPLVSDTTDPDQMDLLEGIIDEIDPFGQLEINPDKSEE